MPVTIRRRELIAAIGSAAAWLFAARARSRRHGRLVIRIRDGEFGIHKCWEETT